LVPLVEGYHYNHRTNGLPAVVSELMIYYAWYLPAFSRGKNRKAQGGDFIKKR
jgi:hypothetical protein